MSAGTLILTNNSATVAGNGTAFTTELAAGDFIVATAGGITYTLPVKSVDSDTALTLVSNYPGPAQAGSAWAAVPRATQNQVTAALVAQTTEALRGLNYDKQNWQEVFSDSGDITVMLPDGQQFSGPSWKKIAELLADIDADALQQLADQINADAQQVSADKTTAGNAATTATDASAAATQKASDAADSASGAAQSATSASDSASSATGSASTATQQADRAKTEADRAEAAADSVDADVINQKIANKADKVDGAVPVTQGGTGATTDADARSSLGVPAGVDAQLATAWGLFGGTGSYSPSTSFNISSVALLQTGIVAVNFATPMISNNYAVSIGFDADSDVVAYFSGASATRSVYIPQSQKTLSGFRIYSGVNSSSSSLTSMRFFNISVFGGK